MAYWTAAPRATFDVEGLTDLPGGVNNGAIAVDTTDSQRIRVTVTVTWTTRHGSQRSMSLSRVLTEVVD